MKRILCRRGIPSVSTDSITSVNDCIASATTDGNASVVVGIASVTDSDGIIILAYGIVSF